MNSEVRKSCGEEGPPEEVYGVVDDLFAMMAKAVRGGVVTFNVRYHPTYGYPYQVWIDRGTCIADEEIGWDITCLSLDNERGEPDVVKCSFVFGVFRVFSWSVM